MKTLATLSICVRFTEQTRTRSPCRSLFPDFIVLSSDRSAAIGLDALCEDRQKHGPCVPP
jgi:hypothetical protein